MVILDEYTRPILLDNIDIPTPVNYFWALDLEMMDFTLKELLLSEELTTKTITIVVNGRYLEAPADWNILIYSRETSELDVIELMYLDRQPFSAFLFNHKKNKLVENIITVQEYSPYSKVQTPSLTKNIMLCHPMGYDTWVCIAPTDSYNKYLKGMVIGDLI